MSLNQWPMFGIQNPLRENVDGFVDSWREYNRTPKWRWLKRKRLKKEIKRQKYQALVQLLSEL